MRIETIMPNTFTSDVLRQVLSVQDDMCLIDEEAPERDIVLIHASMMNERASLFNRVDPAGAQVQVIVTAASQQPDRLAGYLAAGARGYHCAGERLSRLLCVIRAIHAGELRYNPFVMKALLDRYRELLEYAGEREARGTRRS